MMNIYRSLYFSLFAVLCSSFSAFSLQAADEADEVEDHAKHEERIKALESALKGQKEETTKYKEAVASTLFAFEIAFAIGVVVALIFHFGKTYMPTAISDTGLSGVALGFVAPLALAFFVRGVQSWRIG